ncbi:MAG: hypothetical protein ABIT01_18510 [Thermoanaerobaculia bacterium]
MSDSPTPWRGSDVELLTALDELGRIAVAQTELHEIGRRAARLIKNVLDLAYVSLLAIDEAGGEAVLLGAASDLDVAFMNGYRHKT